MGHEDDLALAAINKRRAGQKLTAAESSALKRLERKNEEQQRWKYYRSIPTRHWQSMSGRQKKTLQEQAVHFNIPFGGAEIDLPAVVKAIHDFFAEHKWAIKRGDKGTEEVDWRLQYHREQALMKRVERLKQERQLVSVDLIRDGLSELAAVLKACGTELGKRFGEDVLEVFNDHLETFGKKAEQLTTKLDD